MCTHVNPTAPNPIPVTTLPPARLLYHFVQLVSVVTRDQLDEILVSSFGSCSRDMQNFWEASDHKYIFLPTNKTLTRKKKKKIRPSKPFRHFPCYRVTSVTFSEFEGLRDA